MIAAGTQIDLNFILVLLLSGGWVAVLIRAYKAKPERDAIVVTQAQGATTILNGVIESLHAELERKDRRIAALEEENTRLREMAGRRGMDTK